MNQIACITKLLTKNLHIELLEVLEMLELINDIPMKNTGLDPRILFISFN